MDQITWGRYAGLVGGAVGGIALMSLEGMLPLRWLAVLPVVVVGLLILGRVSRRWLSPFLLMVISFSLSLTLLDFGGRFILFDVLLPSRIHDTLANQWHLYPWVRAYKPNAQLDREIFGDLTVATGDETQRETRRVRFATDEWGFRNAAIPTDEPLDLILLGDSFVMGMGTDETAIFAAQLTDWRVYNLGMADSAPPDHFLIAREYLPQLPTNDQTRLLWFIFAGNDLEDIDPTYYGDQPLAEIEPVSLPWQWIARLNSWRTRSPTRQVLYPVLNEWRSGANQGRVIEASLQGEPFLLYRTFYELVGRSPESIAQHPNYPIFEESIRAVSQLTDVEGLCLTIILLPTKEDVYSTWLDAPYAQPHPDKLGMAAALQGLSNELGVKFWDMTPAFWEASEAGLAQQTPLLWWRDDTHWSSEGHRVVGEWLKNALASGALDC